VHISGDLVVNAANVTVRNSQIDGKITNDAAAETSFLITDSTIGPASGCVTSPGVGEANYTATRVWVRGHDDGFRISGLNVTIQDSYAKLCANSGSHSDGIQSYCPDQLCGNLTFTHNSIDSRGVDATFMINLVDPNLRSVNVSNSLLAGGGYTIDTRWTAGPVWTIRDNMVVDGAWAFGPASADNTCGSQSWSGNAIVTIDASYRVLSTVKQLPCIQ
jgi:hypothetical protein